MYCLHMIGAWEGSRSRVINWCGALSLGEVGLNSHHPTAVRCAVPCVALPWAQFGRASLGQPYPRADLFYILYVFHFLTPKFLFLFIFLIFKIKSLFSILFLTVFTKIKKICQILLCFISFVRSRFCIDNIYEI